MGQGNRAAADSFVANNNMNRTSLWTEDNIQKLIQIFPGGESKKLKLSAPDWLRGYQFSRYDSKPLLTRFNRMLFFQIKS